MSRALKFSHPHLPKTLRFLRERARLTQRQAALEVRRLGGHASPTWISRLESGKAEPSEQLVEFLLASFGSNRSELYSLLEQEKTETLTNLGRYDWRTRQGIETGLKDAETSRVFLSLSSSCASTSHLASIVPVNYASDEETLIQTWRTLSVQDRKTLLDNAVFLRQRHQGRQS